MPPSLEAADAADSSVKAVVVGILGAVAGADLISADGAWVSGLVCCSLTVACGIFLGSAGNEMRAVSFLGETVGLATTGAGTGAGLGTELVAAGLMLVVSFFG